jgi:hypothetical protein
MVILSLYTAFLTTTATTTPRNIILLEMPELPFPYFWRVTALFECPVLELRKRRKFFPSQRINSTWILESTDAHLVGQADFLKSIFENGSADQQFLKKREGDYPPKTLGD